MNKDKKMSIGAREILTIEEAAVERTMFNERKKQEAIDCRYTAHLKLREKALRKEGKNEEADNLLKEIAEISASTKS